jgi:hypothetical protein
MWGGEARDPMGPGIKVDLCIFPPGNWASDTCVLSALPLNHCLLFCPSLDPY